MLLPSRPRWSAGPGSLQGLSRVNGVVHAELGAEHMIMLIFAIVARSGAAFRPVVLSQQATSAYAPGVDALEPIIQVEVLEVYAVPQEMWPPIATCHQTLLWWPGV